MFSTTAFLEVENNYRREQLRRAWGGPAIMRLRRRHWATEARHAHRGAVTHHHRAVAGAR